MPTPSAQKACVVLRYLDDADKELHAIKLEVAPSKLATPLQTYVERFVRQFYAGAVDDAQAAVAARAVAEAVPPGTISVAALQGALMQHPDDTAAGIAACRALGSAEAPSSVQ